MNVKGRIMRNFSHLEIVCKKLSFCLHVGAGRLSAVQSEFSPKENGEKLNL
jgi:hypothetical protein